VTTTWVTTELGEYLTVFTPLHDILPHNVERSAECACQPEVTVTGPPTHFIVTHHVMQHDDALG
jgi:hypothetical protein